MFTAAVTLVTGTLFLMWLGEQITERGIGNGISMIILASIISGLPSAIGGTLQLVDANSTVVDTLNVELEVLGTVLEAAEKELLIFHEGKYSQFSCDQGEVGAAHEKDCRQFMADGGNLSGMDRYLAEIDNLAAHGINGAFNYNDPVDLNEANSIVSNYVFRGINHRIMFGDAQKKFPVLESWQ